MCQVQRRCVRCAAVTLLTVGESEGGERLDLFIGKKLQLSRARLKALFEAGAVRVNGRKAKKGQTIAAGERVEVEIAEEGPRAPVAESSPLTVLHEDALLVFIDKPAGLPVPPLESGERGTVA